jgi:hypothetical protein
MSGHRPTRRRAEIRITALMPSGGWRLVTVEMTKDGAYAGVRCDPITAWVAVEEMGTEQDSGLAYVTHMPGWSPQNGAWGPGEADWRDIGYLAPESPWEPAEWDQLGRDIHAAQQTELARSGARPSQRHSGRAEGRRV